MRTRRLAVPSLLAGALVVPLSWGAPAVADPTNAEHISLTCGSTTYAIVVPTTGKWSAAHDLASTRVFVPNAFGDFTGTVYDANGQVVDSFTEPGSVKGSGKQPSDVSCTFVERQVSDGSDPSFPAGFVFVGTGSVTGHIPH